MTHVSGTRMKAISWNGAVPLGLGPRGLLPNIYDVVSADCSKIEVTARLRADFRRWADLRFSRI
jgi:hypothetical protein